MPKCVWWLIAWVWTNGKARLATTTDAPGEISLTQGDSEMTVPIKRIEPTVAQKGLGMELCPAGAMKAEYARKMKDSRRLGSRALNSSLTRVEAERLYDAVWAPKIGYSLVATAFTLKECTKIMVPFLKGTLPKIGFNQNTPRAITHEEALPTSGIGQVPTQGRQSLLRKASSSDH